MKNLYLIVYSKPENNEGSWDIRTDYVWAKYFTMADATRFIKSFNDPIEGIKVNELRKVTIKELISRYRYDAKGR